MQEILLTIKRGIEELFPVPLPFEAPPETSLNLIPDWDSMSSINFKVFLEETFKMEIPDDLLDGETTIGEIVGHVKKSMS